MAVTIRFRGRMCGGAVQPPEIVRCQDVAGQVGSHRGSSPVPIGHSGSTEVLPFTEANMAVKRKKAAKKAKRATKKRATKKRAPARKRKATKKK